MAEIDDLLEAYARIATDIEFNDTSAGFYTHYGVLSTFLKEVTPLIRANQLAELAQGDSKNQKDPWWIGNLTANPLLADKDDE